MKFKCEKCGTRYNIADERVRNKILKIRCKVCENIIVVRDPESGRGAADSSTGSIGGSLGGGLAGGLAATASGDLSAPPGLGDVEWYSARDGSQRGPMPFERLRDLIRGGEILATDHLWNETLADWQEAGRISAFEPLFSRRSNGQSTAATPPPMGAEAPAPSAPAKVTIAPPSQPDAAQPTIPGPPTSMEWGDVFGDLAGTPVMSGGEESAGGEPDIDPTVVENFATISGPSIALRHDSGPRDEPRRAILGAASASAPTLDETSAERSAEMSGDASHDIQFDALEPVSVVPKTAPNRGSFARAADQPEMGTQAAVELAVGKPARKSNAMWLAAVVVMLGGIGVGAVFVFPSLTTPTDTTPSAASVATELSIPTPSTESAAVPPTPDPPDAAPPVPDAAPPPTPDAAPPSPIENGKPAIAADDSAEKRDRKSGPRTAKVEDERDAPERPATPPARESAFAGINQRRAPVQLASKAGGSFEIDENLPPTLGQNQISNVIKGNMNAVKACLERQLKRDDTISGRTEVKFRIQQSGRATNIKLQKRFKGTVFERCLTQVIRRWRFPRFKGDSIPVEFPLILTSSM